MSQGFEIYFLFDRCSPGNPMFQNVYLCRLLHPKDQLIFGVFYKSFMPISIGCKWEFIYSDILYDSDPQSEFLDGQVVYYYITGVESGGGKGGHVPPPHFFDCGGGVGGVGVAMVCLCPPTFNPTFLFST